MDVALIWEEQHERAAGKIFDVLCGLKGFYLKLGQILATKTDMLPQPYTGEGREGARESGRDKGEDEERGHILATKDRHAAAAIHG